MSWEATLQTNYRCNGGITIADLGVVGNDSQLDEQLDGRSLLRLSLDRDYLELCRRRNAVVFLTAEDGRWLEFRIDGVEYHAKASTFQLTLLPPWYELNSADVVREYVNGRAITSFVESRTIADLIDVRVLGNAAADGLTYFARGTVEYPDDIALTWARLKPGALLLHARDTLKRGEIQIRADGFDGYLIDVVAEIGAALPVVPLRFGDRLRDLQRTTEFGPLYTGIRVVGDAPTADAEPASFGDNVYRVQSVTPIGPGGIGPYAVVLRDPATNVSPIQLDGLFARDPNGRVPACWLQLPTGNTTEILEARAATGDVVVAIAPTVEDRVVIVQDASNTPLDRLVWPAAVAEHDFVFADASVAGGRGERNFIVNPGLDGAASEYSLGIGAIMTLIARDAALPLLGRMNGTKASGAPATFAVDGFVPGDEAQRGFIAEVDGVEFITDGDVFLDENGECTLPILTTLPATIPANTQIRSNAVAYLLARGSGNTVGNAAINVTIPGRRTTPWDTDDELTFTVQQPDTRTLSGATNRTQQFVSLDLATPFAWDIPSGAWLVWTHGAITQMIQVGDAYVASAPSIIVRHPTWTPFAFLRGEVQPFGLAGETVKHTRTVTSTHTVTNSPTWNTSGQATVIITPALPVDMSIALTAVRWDRVGASAFVGNLTLVADQSATATTFAVYGGALVAVIPDGTVLSLVGETFTLTSSTLMDGGGAGTLATVFAPTTTLLDDSVVRIFTNSEWAAEQGGGEHVAMVGSSLTSDENSPAVSDASPRSQPFRVVVPVGGSAQVFARVAITMYSPARTNSTQQYGTAKIGLINLDTNAVVAWAGTQPEDAASLSAPANARLPLTWDPDTRTWLPLHVTMSCNVAITETTRFELRYYGPIGLASSTYGRTYVRWSTAWVAGAVDSIPYLNGSRANDLLLTAVQLLARDAQPADTYTLDIEDFAAAHAAAADLPLVAVPTIEVGGRVLIEEDLLERRVLDLQRHPNGMAGKITVGTRPPSASLTLASVAVVSSVGGTR